MIIGKDSVWKMFALLALVALAVLDLIFCKTGAVLTFNALAVAGSLAALAVKLYRRWSAK